MVGELIVLAVPVLLLLICCCCFIKRKRREEFSYANESTRFTRYSTVDLHGHSVTRAIETLQRKLRYGRPFTAITGQGLHSSGGVGHIRPAVIQYLREHDYSYDIDAWNPGRIHVH